MGQLSPGVSCGQVLEAALGAHAPARGLPGLCSHLPGAGLGHWDVSSPKGWGRKGWQSRSWEAGGWGHGRSLSQMQTLGGRAEATGRSFILVHVETSHGI